MLPAQCLFAQLRRDACHIVHSLCAVGFHFFFIHRNELTSCIVKRHKNTHAYTNKAQNEYLFSLHKKIKWLNCCSHYPSARIRRKDCIKYGLFGLLQHPTSNTAIDFPPIFGFRLSQRVALSLALHTHLNAPENRGYCTGDAPLEAFASRLLHQTAEREMCATAQIQLKISRTYT